MGTPLRALIVEDSEDDAVLLLRELRRGGYDLTFERVDTPAAMSVALAKQPWDIVLADHAMPYFSAPAALKLLQGSGFDLPFIIVSGKIGEDTAVAAMKAGAHDYIMKGNLARLNPAIERELREAVERWERKRAEEALRESEERYRSLVETSPDAIMLTDLDAKILICNHQAAVLHGFESVEEVTGKSAFEFIAPEDRQRAIDNMQRTLEIGSVRNIEYTLLKKDGTRLPAELSASLIMDTQGKPKAFISVVRDITERKKAWELTAAYQQLQALAAEIEQLLASIPSILIGVSPNDRIIRWNAAAEEILGISAAEVLGKPFSYNSIPWDRTKVLESITNCRRKGCLTRLNEIQYTQSDGRKGFLDLTINPLIGDVSKQPGFLLLGADITERKHLESQLALTQKMESIGQLAAGIAHEINTPMQYVGDNTRFLQDVFRDLDKLLKRYAQLLEASKADSMAPELVAEIEAATAEADIEYLLEETPKAIQQSLEGIERVAKIVRAMREFSHPGTEEKVDIDINKAIETTLTVAHNEWQYVADMVTDFDPSLPLVPCLPGEFNQVILNLILNATHAIADVVGDGTKDKGIIAVSTRRDGDWAEIRIRDTGTGIPEAIRARIFDLFFTTKEVGKGTGQGLTISHSVIVNKHGGTIAFETEVGRGTTFIVRLPIAPFWRERCRTFLQTGDSQ